MTVILFLSMPCPILLVEIEIRNLNTHNSFPDPQLAKIKYTSRFALGIFFHEKMQLRPQQSEHRALNFVQNPHSVIRYWSIEHLKRCAGDYELANSNSELPALVVHSSVDYGAQHTEADKVAVASDLLHQLQTETELAKDCESQSDKHAVICHRWNCSQVR